MPLDNLSRPSSGLLGDFANGIDQRKQQFGRLVMGLLSNPEDTIAMLRAGDAEAHQRNLRTPAMDGSSRSVMPEIAQQGRDATMDVAMNVGGLLGMTAYHGSPHLFDKFDIEGMLDNLLASTEIQRAFSKLDTDEIASSDDVAPAGKSRK